MFRRGFDLRWLAAIVLLAPSGPAIAAGPGTTPDPAAPHCESHAPRADRRDIACSIGASGVPRRFRFTARLAGSHDDTTASLAATLDGRPLACDEGSKTRLEGDEEGDVALTCRFSIPPAGATLALRVKLSWHHARYTDFEVGPE